MELYDILEQEITKLGYNFSNEKYNKFVKYMDMIKYYNKMVNITSITEDKEIVIKHFIDSLEIFKFEGLSGKKTVIDVGTGGGFPGIPMKIVNESLDVTLLDSLNKRVNFLNKVIDELKIDGITTIHGRAEDYGKDILYRQKFDVAVSRAVANMKVLSEYCLPFVKKGGYFIALKGPSVDEELESADKIIQILGGKIYKIEKLDILDTDLKHNLVIIKKESDTPKKYPRNPKKIKKENKF